MLTMPRIAFTIIALCLALLAWATAQAETGDGSFYKEIKLCAGDKYVFVKGLDSSKPTHTAATCAQDESHVNWSVDVIATQGGGPWGQGFDCAGRTAWSYKNTYEYAYELQYTGQAGCVYIRITQD